MSEGKKAPIGILYVATKESFLPEAESAAKTAKRYMPKVPIALFTHDVAAAKQYECFDYVYEIEKPYCDFRDKMVMFSRTPFERNLYLDTDTVFMDSVYELFYALEKYDFAHAHEPHRWNESNRMVPECFPEPQCGVLAFRDSEKFQAFNQAILDDYSGKIGNAAEDHEGVKEDQGTVRKLLYTMDHGLRVLALPPEYNLRAYMPYMVSYKVKIVHCRGKFLSRALRSVNRTLDFRTGDGKSKLERVWFNLKEKLKDMRGMPSPWKLTEHRRKNWNWQASEEVIDDWTRRYDEQSI